MPGSREQRGEREGLERGAAGLPQPPVPALGQEGMGSCLRPQPQGAGVHFPFFTGVLLWILTDSIGEIRETLRTQATAWPALPGELLRFTAAALVQSPPFAPSAPARCTTGAVSICTGIPRSNRSREGEKAASSTAPTPLSAWTADLFCTREFLTTTNNRSFGLT